MSISLLYWFYIIVLGSVWGGAFIFSKIAVTEIAPLTLVFLRVGFGALVLWLIVFALGKRPQFNSQSIVRWLVMGLLANALPFALLFYGQRDIGAGLASIINASTVLWTALFAHLLLADEKLTPLKFAGIFVGFAGIVVMIGPDALLGLGKSVIAQILVVAAAMSYGFAAIFSRRFKGSDPLISAAGQLTGASVLIFPLALIIDNPLAMAMPSVNVIWSVVGLVLISTALAYVIFFHVVAVVGALNVSLCTFVVPVVATFIGTQLLGEVLTFNQWLGMAAILVGLLAIDGRVFSKKLRKTA